MSFSSVWMLSCCSICACSFMIWQLMELFDLDVSESLEISLIDWPRLAASEDLVGVGWRGVPISGVGDIPISKSWPKVTPLPGGAGPVGVLGDILGEVCAEVGVLGGEPGGGLTCAPRASSSFSSSSSCRSLSSSSLIVTGKQIGRAHV